MRRVIILLAVAGCASEPEVMPEPVTIGPGQLTNVRWDGGACPRDYHCSGTLGLGAGGFAARFTDEAPVATGTLQQATVDRINELVAAIPADKPTGIYDNTTDGPGIVELLIVLPHENRIYLSNGFEGALGTYLYDLRDAIERCELGPMISGFTYCAP